MGGAEQMEWSYEANLKLRQTTAQSVLPMVTGRIQGFRWSFSQPYSGMPEMETGTFPMKSTYSELLCSYIPMKSKLSNT